MTRCQGLPFGRCSIAKRIASMSRARVIGRHQRPPHRVNELRVPLGVESDAAGAGRPCVTHGLPCRSSAIVIFQGCDRSISSLIHCSRLQPAPPRLRGSSRPVAVAAVDVADEHCHVEAQAVDAIFLKPHQRVVADEPSHFRRGRNRADSSSPTASAPASRCRNKCHRVGPSHRSMPAVELPHRMLDVIRPEMVVDDVEKDGEAVAVRRDRRIP